MTFCTEMVQGLHRYESSRSCRHRGLRIQPRPADLTLVFLSTVLYKDAMDKDTIDSLAARLAASVPEGMRSLGADLEQNFSRVLNSAIGRMDLVTREEFEVSRTVLARTQQQLAELERRLAELNAKD